MLVPDLDTICPLHNTSLERDTVLVQHGLINFDPECRVAHQKLFPKSNFFVLGGCRINEKSELLYDTMYCNLCRNAHFSWCKENNNKYRLPPCQNSVDLILQGFCDDSDRQLVMSPEILTSIEQHQYAEAIKALNLLNPSTSIYQLSKYVQYQGNKSKLERANWRSYQADWLLYNDGRHCPRCSKDIGTWSIFLLVLSNRISCPHCQTNLYYEGDILKKVRS
jgi:hypothetical protein